jgi:hypothetical protein
MLYTNTRVESRFVLTDPTTGGHETLYRSTNLSWFPNLSPDGRQVAFFAEVAPREQIFVLPVDGSAAPKQMTFGSARQANIAPRWYSDGFIDFYENLEARSLLRIPVEGGQPRIIFSEFQWEQNRGLVWSPDRALAAFVRTEAIANGQAPVVIREAATGAEWAVHPEMQSAPVWSQDQRHLLGIGKSGIVNCPVDGTACETLVPASDVGYANWSSDESQVFFLKRSQPRSPVMWDLRVVNRDGTGDRQVAALGPIHPLAGPFQVLPDDRILWNQYSESDTLIFRGDIAR